MAPMHLFLLLEIHCSPSKDSCPHLMHFLTKSTRVKPLEELQEWGLIEADPRVPPKGLDYEPHGWVTTEKGRVFVKALEAMPLPVKIWRMEAETRGDAKSLFESVFGRGWF